MPAICAPISSVALAVCAASAFTSDATTAKPRPASPARAASIVALSASRLVCSAIAVISFTTSPMRPAACDSSLMRPSVCCACFTASLAIRLELLHLAADLVDRRGHLLGRRGDRLHVCRRLLGRGRDRAGELLRHFGGLGQRAGGRLQFGRGRRDGLDDAADRGLEIVGELVHVRLALLGGALLRGLGLGLERARLDHVVLEHLHGRRHAADLVAPRRERNLRRGVAVREHAHRLRDAADRARDAEEAERHRADRDRDAGAKRHERQRARRLVIGSGRHGRFARALVVELDQFAELVPHLGELARQLAGVERGGVGLAVGARQLDQLGHRLLVEREMRAEQRVAAALLVRRDQALVALARGIERLGGFGDGRLLRRHLGVARRHHVTRLIDAILLGDGVDAAHDVDRRQPVVGEVGDARVHRRDLVERQHALAADDQRHQGEQTGEQRTN